MKTIPSLLHDLLHLFYPHVCTGCGSDAIDLQQQLCLSCITHLPFTQFAFSAQNPVEKIFIGRMGITAAHSELYFSKSSIVQHLIHQLKYKGNQAIGHYLGEMMAGTLLKSKRFQQIQALVPVPLYPEKEKIRGYNQAAVICEGMSTVWQIPVWHQALIKQRATATQTKKHRDERWQNVHDSFVVPEPEQLRNARVLLVDDVITTGASLEACGNRLLSIPGLQLSLASLAFAAK